jgi:hypothetical protein
MFAGIVATRADGAAGRDSSQPADPLVGEGL